MEEPIDEVTLRLYPQSHEKGRELTRKMCLIFGCIRPNEKQDSIVDVLHELSIAQHSLQWLKREEIEQKVIAVRKELGKDIPGSSTIRRHLKWLLDAEIIERQKAAYRTHSFKPLLDACIAAHAKKVSTLLEHAKLFSEH